MMENEGPTKGYFMKWEATVNDLPGLFMVMERAKKLGFDMKLTGLLDTQSTNKGYEVFIQMEGDDQAPMAVFLQMLDEENLMILTDQAKESMSKSVSDGIDEAAEHMEWL